jgi:hypothetical protein
MNNYNGTNVDASMPLQYSQGIPLDGSLESTGSLFTVLDVNKNLIFFEPNPSTSVH